MTPDNRFIGLGKDFWAHVRSISEYIGYTHRGTSEIRSYTIEEQCQALATLGLATDHLVNANGTPSTFAHSLVAYFRHRATILNKTVRSLLMNEREASKLFAKTRLGLRSTIPVPMNKQKGSKRKPAYLTGMVNMIIDHYRGCFPCDFDPRTLTCITRNNKPLRTLARRVDGAFPSTINPIALWEIKEYYYTTTFGSRVADGVYETLLDGVELEELQVHNNIRILHYLILDAHYTWWVCGKSYLCRIVDMLHMGLVDEVLVGREVVTRLPVLVKEWRKLAALRVPQVQSRKV